MRRPAGDLRGRCDRGAALNPPARSSRSHVAADGADPREAVAALAHDLRSPTAAVLGFARLARQDLAAGDLTRALDLIDRIERSASTMDAILLGALGEPARPVSDLVRVVDQVRAERKLELERRHIRLVGPTESPLLGVADAQLYRLMTNLIGNAISHMGETRHPCVTVELSRGEEMALLSVHDNGVGIAAEQREAVFSARHSSGRKGGSECHRGLGLAIVRELAESWRGRAWIDCPPGGGTTLRVTIPLAR
jgi:signal transduction histidine kinase